MVLSLAQLTQESWIGGFPFGGQQLRWLARTQLLSTVMRAHILERALESVSLSEEEQLQAMQAFCKQKELQSPEEIEGFRSRLLLSDLDFQRFVERPLRLRCLCERDFLPKAEARFLDRKTSLDRVVYSLIRVAEPWLARELYLRILAQEADFASLAAEFSQGPESKTRGVVGPVPMLQAHPTLAQRLRTCTPGLVLEPFQIDQWWLVVRVENYTPAIFDHATRLAMAEELLEEWIQAEVKCQELRLAPHLLSTDLATDTP